MWNDKDYIQNVNSGENFTPLNFDSGEKESLLKETDTIYLVDYIRLKLAGKRINPDTGQIEDVILKLHDINTNKEINVSTRLLPDNAIETILMFVLTHITSKNSISYQSPDRIDAMTKFIRKQVRRTLLIKSHEWNISTKSEIPAILELITGFVYSTYSTAREGRFMTALTESITEQRIFDERKKIGGLQ